MSAVIDQQIPDKLYFKIGEVSGLLGVKPYVLRYWETEFKEIAPVKSKTNQRLYKRRDVEVLLKIKNLLYKERFTINGAKKRLKARDGHSKLAEENNGNGEPYESVEGSNGSGQLGLEFATLAGTKEAKQELRGVLEMILQEMETLISDN